MNLKQNINIYKRKHKNKTINTSGLPTKWCWPTQNKITWLEGPCMN